MSNGDNLKFDDGLPGKARIYPDWFKLSLVDLSDDPGETSDRGKFGIVVCYGQKRCAYCEKFFEINLADST